MKPIIVSEMRVGSRWIHYLLADELSMYPAPELGKLDKEKAIRLLEFLRENRIPKIHNEYPDNILQVLDDNNIFDVGIIGIVRNPRDRIVSLCFHNRYHGGDYPFMQKLAGNDQEAIKKSIYEDQGIIESHSRQLELMATFHSTRTFDPYSNSRYIWTSYEWLKADPSREIAIIFEFLHRIAYDIPKLVERHSFESRSGRHEGEEKRDDLWRRKGINNDWENWFDEKDIQHTQDIQDAYYRKLGFEVQNANF